MYEIFCKRGPIVLGTIYMEPGASLILTDEEWSSWAEIVRQAEKEGRVAVREIDE